MFSSRSVAMKRIEIKVLITSIWLTGLSFQCQSHPAGDLVAVGNYILWTYVDPINDVEHHASVMIWDGKTVSTLIRSEHTGSNYYLYAVDQKVFYIEARYDGSRDRGYFRVLKGFLNSTPEQIWDWQQDKWGIGSLGFYMDSDEEIIFSRYPEILTLSKSGESNSLFSPDEKPIISIKKLPTQEILLMTETGCLLTNKDFGVLREWDDLILENVDDPPIGRNMICDVDYRNGSLYLAYWGMRTFQMIHEDDSREDLYTPDTGFVPHWVLAHQNGIFLFSSQLNPPDPILPELVFLDNSGDTKLIWSSN